jgi:hypothetical protein
MIKAIIFFKTAFLLSFVIITSSCSAVSNEFGSNNLKSTKVITKDPKENLADKNNGLETIYGFDVKAETLWFLVKSNGCTSESNFTIQLNELNNKVAVSLHRNKRDLCRGLTKLISINMPLIDTKQGDTNFIVSNPFGIKPKRTKR